MTINLSLCRLPIGWFSWRLSCFGVLCSPGWHSGCSGVLSQKVGIKLPGGLQTFVIWECPPSLKIQDLIFILGCVSDF